MANSSSTRSAADFGQILFSDYPVWLKFFSIIAAAIAAVVMNSLVLYVVFKKPSSRTLVNGIFSSAAVAFLIVGATCLPIWGSLTVDGYPWPLGRSTCILWRIVSASGATITYYHFLVISLYRFNSLGKAFAEIDRKEKISVAILITMAWLAPTAFWSYYYLAAAVNDTCNVRHPVLLAKLAGSLLLLAPLGVAVTVNILTCLMGISRKAGTISPSSATDDKDRNPPASQAQGSAKSVYRPVLVTGVAFCIWWTPSILCLTTTTIQSDFIITLCDNSMLLFYLTTLIHPFLLLYFTDEFHAAIRRIFGTRRRQIEL